MARALDQYGVRVFDAILAVADFIATKMQNHARQNARWQDRTGNARSGLFGAAVKKERGAGGQFLATAERTVEIYLSHGSTVFYGKFLELAHGGKYAIIWPTIEKYLPELKRLLDGIFR
ncbi:MAG: hypothetical protein KJ077_08140 [Anaerolineae bacterium]|nr:hypothetical protein [Anaerolineae bacterium]